MTARKAIQKLIDSGLLVRQPSGRLEVLTHDQPDGGPCQLAMLVPAFESHEVHAWQTVMVRTATDYDCSLRIVYYSHWDDPTILRALHGFSGVFFLPPAGAPPESITEELAKGDDAVVVIDYDWSAYNVPSLRLFPLASVHLLLDHLYDIGCRRIACMNTQPEDPIVLGRIQQWRMWMARHRLEGPLVHEPVEPYSDAFGGAYETAGRFLDAGGRDVDAIMCVTEAAAIGAVRALTDRNIQAGRELAVCAVNGHIGRFTVPSITSLARPDAASLIGSCIQWMKQAPRPPWIGPLLVEPAKMKLDIRESTRNATSP
jgi:DNA-binding LacI/PurR family transcriptional regulator